jgi:GNAT superfamily N-acetyltransferase
MSLALSTPQPLAVTHVLDDFACGEASLDEWLKRRALTNQLSGASRTFVVADQEGRVHVNYAMAAGAVSHQAAISAVRRNMPAPVPVVVLGRLAVATSHHAKGLGRALFKDAAQRVIHAADAIGIRGLVMHALSEEAKAFYLRLGLDESPLDPMTLMITVADLHAAAHG